MAKDNKKLELTKTDSLEYLTRKVLDSKSDVDVKRFTSLLRISQAKKELIRVVRLTEALDRLEEELFKRLEDSPERFHTDELMNLTKVIQSSIDRSNKIIDDLHENETLLSTISVTKIAVKPPKSSTFDLNARERIKNAVSGIIKSLEEEERIIIEVPEEE